MEMIYDRAEARIDLDALRENLTALRANVAEGVKLCLVVKADGYGHGAAQTARAAGDLADCFAAATPEEALTLRRAGINKPVMILGHSQPSVFGRLIQNNIWPVFYREEDARVFSETACALGKTGRFQIKLDCGMGRIGFLPGEESADAIARICALPGVSLEGVFTHFSRADEADKGPVLDQLETFLTMKKLLEDRGVHPALWHCDNSAGILDLPQAGLSLVRAGIAAYGCYPSDEVSRDVPLRPMLSLHARVIYVKTLPAGWGVSYNATYVTDRETRVATVPIGYGDGYPRRLSGCGSVLVRGRRAPILGRVCMDQLMIDVTRIPETQVGDIVTLIGRDGDEEITADEAAGLAGTISYELLCGLGARIPRVYVEGGSIVGTRDVF